MASGQPNDTKAVRQGANYLQCLAAYGAGGAQNGYPLYITHITYYENIQAELQPIEQVFEGKPHLEALLQRRGGGV